MLSKEKIKKHFISGLLTLLPISLTVFILVKLVMFFDNIFGKILQKVWMYIPGIGFILLIIIIFVIGKFANLYIGKRILKRFETMFLSVPLVNRLYQVFKQLSQSFLLKNKDIFEDVGLIEYPMKDRFALVLLTGETVIKLKDGKEIEFTTIFIPTTPNPTSGFMLLIESDNIVKLKLNVEEALKMIISGGVVKQKLFEKWLNIVF